MYDDGSTDGSVDVILARYASNLESVDSTSQRWNRFCEQSCDSPMPRMFIVHLDSDDRLMPTAVGPCSPSSSLTGR